MAVQTTAVFNAAIPGDAADVKLNGEAHAVGETTLNLLAAGTGTASGATTDDAGYAVGATEIALASAGSGTLTVNDFITFDGDETVYRVTEGDTDVSNGGTITITPGLVVPLDEEAVDITLQTAYAGAGEFIAGDIIQIAGDGTYYNVVAGDEDASDGGTITISPALEVAIPEGSYPEVTVVSNQRFVGQGRLLGVTCAAGTTPTVTIYDNASEASGKILWVFDPASIGGTVIFPGDGIPFSNGLHCVVTGSSTPKFIVFVA